MSGNRAPAEGTANHLASPNDAGLRPRERTLCAALAGVALTASFPPGFLSWLAWVALVPLLRATEGLPRASAFRLGLWAGVVHYLTLLYWILLVLGHYGGLSPLLSAPILILLCLYLALYPALFCLLFVQLRRTKAAPLWGAALWVALEYARAHLLSGFPWCLLGYSQFKTLTLIQFADVLGVLGVSFLIAWVNISVYFILTRKAGGKPGASLICIAASFLFLVIALGYGRARLDRFESFEASSDKTKVAVIQANIDESVKWDPAYQESTIDLYERLTLSAKPFEPRLVVWPETAVPFFFGPAEERLSRRVVGIVRASGSPLLFGSPAYERSHGKTRFFNRAYLLSPDGRLLGSYDKIHLVPFGEYVPFQKFLFFVQRLVPAAGDFMAGEKTEPIRCAGADIGVLICYEAIFSELARRNVEAGANLLVNITNDAWFGMTSAPYQHLAMSAFRALENRVPMVRAANTGISAFVSRTGRILNPGPLFSEAVILGAVAVPTAPTTTFYTKWGDSWVLVLYGLLILRLGWGCWGSKKPR